MKKREYPEEDGPQIRSNFADILPDAFLITLLGAGAGIAQKVEMRLSKLVNRVSRDTLLLNFSQQEVMFFELHPSSVNHKHYEAIQVYNHEDCVHMYAISTVQTEHFTRLLCIVVSLNCDGSIYGTSATVEVSMFVAS